VSPNSVDEDDWLHKPDKRLDDTGTVLTGRGISTVGCIALLAIGLVALLYASLSNSAEIRSSFLIL
jgi:beta-glucan synthesis-associated protein KRE6